MYAKTFKVLWFEQQISKVRTKRDFLDENLLRNRYQNNNKKTDSSKNTDIKRKNPSSFFNSIDDERFHAELYAESFRNKVEIRPTAIEKSRPSIPHPPTIAIQHDYEDYYGGHASPTGGYIDQHLVDNNGQLNSLFNLDKDRGMEVERNIAYTRKRYTMPNDPYWKDMWYLVIIFKDNLTYIQAYISENKSCGVFQI